MSEDSNQLNTIELAIELTIAWLSNPNTRVSADEVPAFLNKMRDSIASLAGNSIAASTPNDESAEYVPAVSIRKSLSDPDHIISMIDGKKYKTLRRHLATHGMTPEEYRVRYGLKPDYPIVSPNYSDSRRAMAVKIGLGRKPGQTNMATAKAAEHAPRKRKADDAAN
ncbi:MucR family transcriptional regulator [Sphingomonas sp. 22R3R2A-7]|uniref:MucR family transcriptional regulator n=1 Tax=Sphingomonas sp. 22R3R2A-7 TaxID=3050230 RepID=UPI002FE2B623